MFATDFFFEKLSTGETAFYPHGLTSRGYVLAPEQEVEARRRMKRAEALGLAGFSLLVLPVWFLSFSPAVLALAVAALSLLADGAKHLYLRPVLNHARRAPRRGVEGWLRALGRVPGPSKAMGTLLVVVAFLWVFLAVSPQGPNQGLNVAALLIALVFVMFGAVHFYAADEHGVKTRR